LKGRFLGSLRHHHDREQLQKNRLQDQLNTYRLGKRSSLFRQSFVVLELLKRSHLLTTTEQTYTKSPMENLTGNTYGKWEVLNLSFRKNNHYYFLCKCLCGNKSNVRGYALKIGRSTQCEVCSKTNKNFKVKHGLTKTEQSNNTRSNVFIELDGQRKTIAQWSRDKNMNYDRLRYRVGRGWPAERLFLR
jgi:hypothetical protein